MDAPWKGATWIDLCDPTAGERDAVAAATGLRVPTKDAIEEIETTSRTFTENGAFYLSTPVLAPKDARVPLSDLGFVLTEKVLISVRFAPHPVIDAVLSSSKEPALSAPGVFLRLVEALVDNGADTLERASIELDAVSHQAFRNQDAGPRRGRRASESLRQTLRTLGQMGDGVSHARDALLGIGRIAAFVSETNGGMFGAGELPRLHAVRADIASLNDYQAQLSGKVQFILDATLGFISIEQNDVVKTLTIVSVVGVPPVLVAGIYGMNFHLMPELSWRYGYPFALLLIVASTLLPLVVFKWRGWM
jgi:magnesium transporter